MQRYRIVRTFQFQIRVSLPSVSPGHWHERALRPSGYTHWYMYVCACANESFCVYLHAYKYLFMDVLLCAYYVQCMYI